jgi:DNA-binding CsgD family transcriptional regulator
LAPDEYFESGHYYSLKINIAEEEEIGYVTQDWPRGMEEVVMMIELPDQCMGEISLLQPVVDGGFDQGDLNLLGALQPVINAAFSRYWQLIVAQTDPSKAADSLLDDALAQFGAPMLTPREQEVTRYILRGHSSISVGLHLDISVTTVKTHRKHIYSKLGIGSQFELFSLFINHLVNEQGVQNITSFAQNTA